MRQDGKDLQLPQDYTQLSSRARRTVREEYVRRQEGRCMFCDQPLTGNPAEHVMTRRINWRLFPPNFLRYPVHLQHNHDTGMTEGAVHARCNAVMWQYLGR